MWDTGAPTSVAQAFLVLDPAAFGPVDAFHERMRAWRAEVTSAERQPGVDAILLAGDREWAADDRQRERVTLDPSIVDGLARVAVDQDIRAAWTRLMRA